MQKYEVKDHEPSYLPEGSWKLAWADEFDGTELDRTKWDFRLNFWGEPFEAFTDQGVILDGNSHMEMHRTERNGCYVSPQLQTGSIIYDAPKEEDNSLWRKGGIWPFAPAEKPKFVHRYGYYECRCRLQQKEGWWSAFWLQSPVIGASLDPKQTGSEVDIMESFHPGKIDQHNVFTGGYGLDMQRIKVGEMDQVNVEEFHRFGVLWEPNGYTFYIDGVEDGKVTENVSGCPQFILISTEPRGYRFDDHQPIPEAYEAVGDTFVVDYVRVFDRVDA